MNKVEALKYLTARLRVLDNAVNAMYDNKTFSLAGDWNAHATVEAMRSMLGIWIRDLDVSLGAKSVEPEREPVEIIEHIARTTLEHSVGDEDQILAAYKQSLENIEDIAREVIINDRKN